MKKTALIMAGGKGERFWPKSRAKLPKQFLSLTGSEKTMIQLTVERILPIVDIENIFVATNADYKDIVKEQLPGLPEENILCEPMGRNTAPCIGLGAVHIADKFDDALMLVLPSDHLITQAGTFRDILNAACETALSDENLVTIGITPSYPETGYGYICYDPDREDNGAYPVERFVEKPDLKTAEHYLKEGNYLWNSGMFIWKCSSILKKMANIMPELYEGLIHIKAAIGREDEEETLRNEFSRFESVSIDYGIMEKADHIYTVPGDFGWDDVGSWLAVKRLQKEDKDANTINANTVVIDSENCLIEGGKRLIAAVGIKDLVIVDTPDAILICDNGHTNDIKKVLSSLKEEGKDEYL